MSNGSAPKSKLPLRAKIILWLIIVSVVPAIFSTVITQIFINNISLVLVGLIFIVLVIILVIINLSYKITNPLLQLKNGLDSLLQNNFSFRMTLNSQDELGQIATSYNQLSTNLNTLIASTTTNLGSITLQRDFLQNILATFPEAVIVLNSQLVVIFLNTKAEQLLGTNMKSSYGKAIGLLIKVFSSNDPLLPDEYCPTFNTVGQPQIFTRKGIRLVSEKESYADLVSQPLKFPGGLQTGHLLTFHDISDEKHFDEMKLDFVSMAAHELRTPLTAIKGYLYVFLRDYGPYLNQEQVTFLTRVNIAAQKLVSLVENLLNITRIEKKALVIHLEPIDWIDDVKTTVEEFRDQAKDKRQELIFVTPTQEIPKLKVDKFRINEVLANLISNAISYTPIGGRIAVLIEKGDQEVITHVQDTGEGIPADAIPHLFNKFFRVSGVLEQGSKGTGLGLYITKTIVGMHNGRIWVKSEVGKGSTFSFSLPVVAK